MRRKFPLALLLVVLVGCAGESYKVAPVSGRVTLNGSPLAKASVTFSPVGDENNQEPGPGSAAITDAEGRYTLELITAKPGRGAVVGKHKVRIVIVDDTRDAGDDRPRYTSGKQLPAEFNNATKLEYDVPAEGAPAADFHLTVR